MTIDVAIDDTASVKEVAEQKKASPISTVTWRKETINSITGKVTGRKDVNLTVPTLEELLATEFRPRLYLLSPWLREQESVMLYADTGVGKSMFALSMALAVAGGGEFLGWKPERKANGEPWRVLYVDGEMHAQDIQERALLLLDAIPEIDREAALRNLRLLPRQMQEPGTDFPSITDEAGMKFILERVRRDKVDLLILDNFSTLGEVDDENDASCFNAIQDFLLRLKTTGVATVLVHHANKAGDSFRGSSKLGATFEAVIHLARPAGKQDSTGEATFRVEWIKDRTGGAKGKVRPVLAKLTSIPATSFGEPERAVWEHEAGALDRLEEIKDLMENGNIAWFKEIADFYGVSKPAVTKYIDRGKALGLWTDEDVSRWLDLGKRLRKLGKRQAPPKVDRNADFWGDDEEDDGDEPF